MTSPTAGLNPFTPTQPSNFDASNRLPVGTITYDSAGNPTTMGGYVSTYDAENHAVSSTINAAPTMFAYDWDGRRVQKVTCAAEAMVAHCGAIPSVYDVLRELGSSR